MFSTQNIVNNLFVNRKAAVVFSWLLPISSYNLEHTSSLLKMLCCNRQFIDNLKTYAIWM